MGADLPPNPLPKGKGLEAGGETGWIAACAAMTDTGPERGGGLGAGAEAEEVGVAEGEGEADALAG